MPHPQPAESGGRYTENMPRVRVKICGVTTPEDVRLVADAGADAVGVNFYAKSPRFVSPQQADVLLREVPPLVEAVGVFVGLHTRQICALAYQLGLRSVQYLADIHDVEDPYPFRQIAVFRVRDRATIDEISHYLEQCRARRFLPAAVLVDAHVVGQFGGTGVTAPWDLLRNLHLEIPLILAGGLNPENVGEAISIVRPYAVDVASGVEAAPGRKDHDKVRRFIDSVRQASA